MEILLFLILGDIWFYFDFIYLSGGIEYKDGINCIDFKVYMKGNIMDIESLRKNMFGY